jgi:hypothetical protein
MSMLLASRVSDAGLLVSFLLVLAGAGVVALGAKERCESPRFGEYTQEQLQQFAPAVDGNETLNPAGRMGFVVSQTAAFDNCCSGLLILVFVSGVLMTRAVEHAFLPVRIGVSAVFAVGSLLAGIGFLEDAAENRRWGFNTLALGHVVTAIGLVLGALTVAINQMQHPRPQTWSS